MATGVVADRALLVSGQLVQLRQQLFDRRVLPLRAGQRRVGVVDVGLVMAVVMDLHRGRVDVGLERVERIGESGKLEGHVSSSGVESVC